MIKTVLIFAILALTMAGCGNSDTQQGTNSGKTVDDTSMLCSAIENMGFSNQCKIDSRYGSVDVMIDSLDDEVARKTCANIAQKMMPQVASFTGSWKLQIFSPYRSDKPTATCVLH